MLIKMEEGDDPLVIENEDGHTITIQAGARGELEIVNAKGFGLKFGETRVNDDTMETYIDKDEDEGIVALVTVN